MRPRSTSGHAQKQVGDHWPVRRRPRAAHEGARHAYFGADEDVVHTKDQEPELQRMAIAVGVTAPRAGERVAQAKAKAEAEQPTHHRRSLRCIEAPCDDQRPRTQTKVARERLRLTETRFAICAPVVGTGAALATRGVQSSARRLQTHVDDIEKGAVHVGRASQVSVRLATPVDAAQRAVATLETAHDRILIDGEQYVSVHCSERLAEADIERSVGSNSDSYDNALAETINGLFKAEFIHRRSPWGTRELVALATLV